MTEIGLDKAVAEAAMAAVETDYLDFKREFDPAYEGDWCELLKDIVAIGNAGGGFIVIGVDRAGDAVGIDPKSLLKKLDPAAVGDKIRKYTGGCLPVCTVHGAIRKGASVLVIAIGGTRVPVSFEKAGTYNNRNGKSACAFSEGTFYFRHNTKSEPGTTEDLERAIEREVTRRRDEWLGNIRRVLEAPSGSEVFIGSESLANSGVDAARLFKLTDDPNAVPVAYRSRDETHPHRMKELVASVSSRLPAGVKITSGDVMAVRRAFDTDADPNWTDIAKHGSKQYSRAFEDWLVQQFSKDPRFAAKAKLKARREGR